MLGQDMALDGLAATEVGAELALVLALLGHVIAVFFGNTQPFLLTNVHFLEERQTLVHKIWLCKCPFDFFFWTTFVVRYRNTCSNCCQFLLSPESGSRTKRSSTTWISADPDPHACFRVFFMNPLKITTFLKPYLRDEMILQVQCWPALVKRLAASGRVRLSAVLLVCCSMLCIATPIPKRMRKKKFIRTLKNT